MILRGFSIDCILDCILQLIHRIVTRTVSRFLQISVVGNQGR